MRSMELEEIAEPEWPAEASAEGFTGLDDEPAECASDYPIWMDEDPGWVDAYEL